jgi:polyhydroxybutyrate depolymerase
MSASRGLVLASLAVLALSCKKPQRDDLPELDLSGEPPPGVALPHVVDPCLEPAAAPQGEQTLTVDGATRTFRLDVPPIDPTHPLAPRPLVLAFHGWGGDPDQLERTTQLASRGTERGFVIARPLGVAKSWNAGTCCGESIVRSVDDVAFARALVGEIGRRTCIDRTRVYAAGFSNGGFLAHRLGCEAADTFAAVASVSGTLGFSTCAPSRPVAVLQIHGHADRTVPFDGNVEKEWSSVSTVIETWVRANGCGGEPEEIFHNGKARCVQSGACAAGAVVTLCRDERAGHTWPGGPKSVGYGGSQDIDSTGTILDFFGRFPASSS